MLLLTLLILMQREHPSQDFSAITNALREQRFADALSQTNELLSKNKRDPRIWTFRGLAQAGLNQNNDALQDFHHAVALQSNYLPALKAEAQLEYATHDPQSFTTLNRITQLQPKDAVSHAMLASLAYQRRDCKAVLTNYAASEQLIQGQSAALTEYGQCLFQLEQKLKALEVFTKVLAVDPQSWQSRYNLAVAELLYNHSAEAIAALQPLLAIPNPPSRVLDLASSAHERIGDTPRAVIELRNAIVSDPTNEALYLHFADLSFAHNSFQVGVAMLTAGLQKLPASAQLYLARGILYVQLGEYAQAESDFAKASQLDPTQAFSSVAQGLSQLQRSNLDGALATAREQLRQNPNDAYLQYVKAETLRQKGAEPGTPAFDEALAAAKNAVRLKPGFSLAEDLLGTFYLRLSQFGLARQQFQEVLNTSPEDESALYHLITLSRKIGRASDIPLLMKRLSQAKAHHKSSDEQTKRYMFVESSEAH